MADPPIIILVTPIHLVFSCTHILVTNHRHRYSGARFMHLIRGNKKDGFFEQLINYQYFILREQTGRFLGHPSRKI